MNDLTIFDALTKLADRIEDPNNELLRSAESYGEEALDQISQFCVQVSDVLRTTAGAVNDLIVAHDSSDQAITSDSLDELAAIATEFDKSEDAMLQRQASVIDELLMTVAADKKLIADLKNASDNEIEKLRKKYKDKEESLYNKKSADMEAVAVESAKAVDHAVKEYAPLEAALSTRTCPDHPGAQMMRVADAIYQCSLDKAIYNYAAGFTAQNGNKVPGGDVSLQTKVMESISQDTAVKTRESELNA